MGPALKTKHLIIIGDSRDMREVEDESVHLIVTSPPYPMIEMWDELFASLDERVKEALDEALGKGDPTKRRKQALKAWRLMHDVLDDTWRECWRVLVEGGLMCINIGDALRNIGGSFQLFPNHAEVIRRCLSMGFTVLPYILWKKPTNRPRYKGKGCFLGSGFLPPNAYVTLDCEFILIFRKGGPRKFKPKDPLRYASRFTKRERDSWFTQIWDIVGTKQTVHERRVAAFPEEIPRRLIRMFSVIGDTVLDPFLGTGTTTKVAMELMRNSIGYEIDKELKPIIMEKVGLGQTRLTGDVEIKIIERLT